MPQPTQALPAEPSLSRSLASRHPEMVPMAIASLSEEQARTLLKDWTLWARPDQLPPVGRWRFWLDLRGRGAGKTRTGAEWVRGRVEAGLARRIALIGETAADAREVMVEGESGILACSPDWNRPRYEPSKRRLTWRNGAIATTYSADDPEQLRGPVHDTIWWDEAAKGQYPDDVHSNADLGLRAGETPQMLLSTTPRPIPLIRDLVLQAKQRPDVVVVTRGSTYANAANLPTAFLEQLRRRYDGTRLGRQEIHGEILDDVPGALWTRAVIEAARQRTRPDLERVVVAIDPAVTSGEDSDETGIIVAGKGVDGRAYILEDLTCRLSPDGWARRAVDAYDRHNADRIVAEVNNGGDLVERVIRTADINVSYRAVRASRGKRTRAEPIAALYEQGRVTHVGMFAELEDQMVSFAPGFVSSPDRVDALVWALSDLMLTEDVAFAF
jgi:predicted phage terminase large subunit-like protein